MIDLVYYPPPWTCTQIETQKFLLNRKLHHPLIEEPSPNLVVERKKQQMFPLKPGHSDDAHCDYFHPNGLIGKDTRTRTRTTCTLFSGLYNIELLLEELSVPMDNKKKVRKC